ncbi:hypothetical protein [Saccharopolyspora taberi]|uniref:Uncharacterized protein n=1 Tax=Saccharopolyspora taberi TaxID=60895 RepID=A0ABN3VML7_9PSEU
MAGEFHVDLKSIDKLSTFFMDAAGYVDDAKAFVNEHADFSVGEEGALLRLIVGGHEKVRYAIPAAFAASGHVVDDLAASCSFAVAEYEDKDDESKDGIEEINTRLDGMVPKSFDAGKELAEREQRYDGAEFDFSAGLFEEVATPTDFLKIKGTEGDSDDFKFNWGTDILSPSAYPREACQLALGLDPMHYVVQWLSGDWAAYADCAKAWRACGEACAAYSTNLVKVAKDIPQAWTGETADYATRAISVVADAYDEMKGVCDALAEKYDAIAEEVKSFYKVLGVWIPQLLDYALMAWISSTLAAATSETGAGAVGFGGVAAWYVYKAIQVWTEVWTYYQTICATVEAFKMMLSGIEAEGVEGKKIPTAFSTYV